MCGIQGVVGVALVVVGVDADVVSVLIIRVIGGERVLWEEVLTIPDAPGYIFEATALLERIFALCED